MIGAGNLATQLSFALKEKGFSIVQVYSRTKESATALAEKTDTAFTTSIKDIHRNADIYIFAVKDSAINELLLEMPQVSGLLLHTAGSVSVDVFESFSSRYGVFYPLQTFSKNRKVKFDEIPVFIEANNREDENLLLSHANKLSKEVYILSSEKRKYLHLSAVFACNFTNHMYALASDILEKEGIPRKVLLPLIDETAQKVHELEPLEAQTGPAVRYDQEVMQKHLQLITDEATKEIYQLISKDIYKLTMDNSYE